MLAAAQVENLFGQIKTLPDARDETVFEYAVERVGGSEGVLELISSGRLVAEIAFHLEVPVLWFSKWCDKQLDAAQLDSARKLCAESLMTKSALVLTAAPGSGTEATQARALANHYSDLAGKMNPDAFGAKPADSLGQQNVQIFLDFGDGAPTTIEHVDVVEAQVEELPEIMDLDLSVLDNL